MLSSRHLQKINAASTGADRLKAYRKYFSKDSARHFRRLERLYRKKWDSTLRVVRKGHKIRGAEQLERTVEYTLDAELARRLGLMDNDGLNRKPEIGELAADLKEHLTRKYGLSDPEIQAFARGDTAVIEKAKNLVMKQASPARLLSQGQRTQLEALQKTGGTYSQESLQYVGFLKDSVRRLDSLETIAGTLAQRHEMATEHFLGGVTDLNELKSYQSELHTYRSSLEQYRSQMEVARNPSNLKEKSAEALAEQKERLSGWMNKVVDLKGKYSTLINSNDLSTGIKAKSLAGTPFRQRWVIGGNFNIASTSPFTLDLSLQLGYRIDKRFQAGVSGVYRASFVETANLTNAISPERYGYSIFSSYGLIGNFFGYAEWEHTTNYVISDSDTRTTAWVSSLLFGIGRTFNVHPKVKGSILILGNLLHENGKSPYHSPLVIKTGFQLTELALMRR